MTVRPSRWPQRTVSLIAPDKITTGSPDAPALLESFVQGIVQGRSPDINLPARSRQLLPIGPRRHESDPKPPHPPRPPSPSTRPTAPPLPSLPAPHHPSTPPAPPPPPPPSP